MHLSIVPAEAAFGLVHRVSVVPTMEQETQTFSAHTARPERVTRYRPMSDDSILNRQTLADTRLCVRITTCACYSGVCRTRTAYGGERIARPQHRVKTAAYRSKYPRRPRRVVTSVVSAGIMVGGAAVGEHDWDFGANQTRFHDDGPIFSRDDAAGSTHSRGSTPVRSDHRRSCARA